MDIPETPETVDARALQERLDGRWGRVRATARERLGALPHLDQLGSGYATDTETLRAQVYDQISALAGTEFPAIGFPESVGGRGDIGGSVVSIEMLGLVDLSLMVKAGVQWGLFGGAVHLLGTDRHHERYLPSVIDFALPGCFAMTETGHGSDVQHLRTTAEYDPSSGEFVVNTPHEAARKDYIGNAARDGRMAVVFAQLITGGRGYGVHALLVPIRDESGASCPGVEVSDCGQKAGLNGVDNGRISFDHVRVPREALLNRFGDVAADGTYTSPIEGDSKRFFTMLGTLIRGRIAVAGAAGSATKTALTIAVRYGEVRRQFRKPESDDPAAEVPVLDYLAHQRTLLPALARTYAFHFAQEELVATLHEIQSGDESSEHESRELESRAAGIKALATWHADRTIQECREACGGAGYLSENQLPRWKADIDVFTTFEGDNTVMLQLVAKGLLTGYRDQVTELGSLGMARMLAETVVGTVVERTAARPVIESLVDAVGGGGGDEELFDRGWQLRLFSDREQHVMETCARRLRRAGSGDADPFDVFNDAQDHVLRLGRVHVERAVLEAFVAGIHRCPDEQVAALLDRVCDLYMLSAVESDIGWFLGHNRLNQGRAKAVTSAVNELCQALRPHASTLVDAFAIPDAWLKAPIATGAEHRRQEATAAHDRKA